MTGETSDIDLSQFSYDPLTGRPFCGQFDGDWIKAHRLAWRLQTGDWPEGVIDHINGNDQDNRFSNLRDVTQSVNMKNQKRHSRHTSGATGVYWRKDVGRWQAVITANKKNVTAAYPIARIGLSLRTWLFVF